MAKDRPRKKRTFVDALLTVILLAAIGVFCYAGYNLLSIYFKYKEGRDQYTDLAKMAVTEKDPDAPAAESPQAGAGQADAQAAASVPEEIPVPPIQVDLSSLKAINDDVIGWIYMEAFDNINYPVTRGIDNDFYLHRNIRKEYLYAGTVFMDKLNHDDFNDCYTILYGHNMKDGSMFGKLSDFISKPSELDRGKYFWIFTPRNTNRYEIISIYNAPVDGDTYTNYKGPGREYQEFLNRVQGYTEVYLPAVPLNVKDKLVCLSTCLDNHDYSRRVVVIGKLVNQLPAA